MGHLRTLLGVCVVTAFMVLGLVPVSALAGEAPEFGRCEAKAGGRFGDANCLSKAKSGHGAYEWRKGNELPPTKFSGESESAALLSVAATQCKPSEARVSDTKCVEEGGQVEPLAQVLVECEREHDGGELAGGNSVVNFSISLDGCKELGTIPCSNTSAEGEIQLEPVSGKLGYLNRSQHEVGLLIAAGGGAAIARFECGSTDLVVGEGNATEGAAYPPETSGGNDSVISTITPVDQMTSEFTRIFAADETQENIPHNFEGLPIALLEAYVFSATEPLHSSKWSKAATEAALVDTLAGEAEIRTSNAPGGGGGSGESGAVTGTVTDVSSNPIEGAVVSICDEEESECYEATTASDGTYTITGVLDGTYSASVSPPSGSPFNELAAAPFNVTGTATTTKDFTLTKPIPPPYGTVVSGVGTTEIGGFELPVINWSEKSPISTQACVGGTVTVTITAQNTSNGNIETTSPVTLSEDPAGSGTFTGELPAVYPIHGVGSITIAVTGCQQPSEEETIEFTIYIDPSGTVVDGNNGDAPVAGATVTLLSSDKLRGSYIPVANGSTVMSPGNRTNPDTSTANGTFGWDTLPGFYEVQASKAGCGTATSPAFQVPPPMTSLQLVLHCVQELTVETSSLPEATRGQAYSTQLLASGGVSPYKWKHTAALPKGLKLSKTGLLYGTPKMSLAPREYPIAIEVSDSEKRAAKQTVTATLMLKVS